MKRNRSATVGATDIPLPQRKFLSGHLKIGVQDATKAIQVIKKASDEKSFVDKDIKPQEESVEIKDDKFT